jgi:hypothetical protein
MSGYNLRPSAKLHRPGGTITGSGFIRGLTGKLRV